MLTLSETQRLQHRQRGTPFSEVHPFRLPGENSAEINFFNCLQIVYEFTAKVMGQCVSQEVLLRHQTRVVRGRPRQVRRLLVEVRHPSPDGLIVVTLEQVAQYWGSVNIAASLDPERCRNFSRSDIEKRRFLYVVAVLMAQRGFLTPQNQPSQRALLASKAATPELCSSTNPEAQIRQTMPSLPEPTEGDDPVASSSTSSAPKAAAPQDQTEHQTQLPTLQDGPELDLSDLSEAQTAGPSPAIGLQGAVGGAGRLYIVFVLCREGGQATRAGQPNIAAVRTLLYRGNVC
jgi:hypothetical protein